MSEPSASKAPRRGLRYTAATALVAFGLVAGSYLLLMLLFAHPAVASGILAIAVTAWVLLILLVLGHRRKKWFKVVAALGLIWVLIAGGNWAMYEYRQSIPRVSDRGSMLYEWTPFKEGTRAVSLAEESTLTLPLADAASLRIDGATALYPVYASFARNAFEPSSAYTDYPDGRLRCNGTTSAYSRLIQGYEDVIFCAGPSKAQLQAAEDAGVELHLTPIGREAFVFFVNSKNPVTGLTVTDIQSIYTGKITNWQDLGGKNQRIRAYQRDEGSGSQTAMQQVMAGLPLMDAPREDVVGDMGGIISRVADYRNYEGAIGYTFRFYSNEMVGNDQIRLLALNGVAPTKETIRDGSYPISSYFYAVTASPIGSPAPEESNETLRAFLDWCTGPQGQWIVEQVGYVSIE